MRNVATLPEGIPFFEVVRPGGRVTPHVRIYRLLYSRHLDWAYKSKMRHLFWRFWWVRP